MAKPIHHALNSARIFGGDLRESFPIHQCMDSSKRGYPKMAHRLVFHSLEGVELLRSFLPHPPKNFEAIALQHIEEDLGFIPEDACWSREFDPQHPWLRAPDWSVEDHCAADAKRFGGDESDYREIHEAIQRASQSPAGRARFFSSWGCYAVEQLFSEYFQNSAGTFVSTRDLAEQHCLRVLKVIPTLGQWLEPINKPWMAGQRKVSFFLVD